MSKITNIEQALDKTVEKLSQEEYQTLNELSNISEIFLAQALILELDKYQLTNKQIGTGVGRSERTIRAWRGAKQCPTLAHAVALVKFYRKVKNA
jgi:hypothetical protein